MSFVKVLIIKSETSLNFKHYFEFKVVVSYS